MAHAMAVSGLVTLKRPPPQNDGFGDDNGHADEKPKARRREADPAAALAAARHEFGEHGGVNMSIEASATFTVMEPDTMRRLFSGELGPDRGDLYIYSRHFNPTVLALGRQMAALEGTEAAYCTASGMSAISSVLMQLVGAGDHVVASRCLYGGTHALLSKFLPRASGVRATFVDTDDEAAVRAAVRPGETRVVYVETMSNPTLAVADIPMLARVAHEAGAKLVVDNTFTPVIVSPARLGADVVVHSVSKFISGGADIIAELTIKHHPSTTIYNSTLAKTLVEYASAIYTADLTQLFTWTCARCGDLIEGFEMIELIVDVENCLQAYVGFANDINAVVVVFRGTQENSIQNWIEDLLWKQLDLDYPGTPEAMVHQGFYSAYHNTTLHDGVVNGIQKTQKLYGDVPIMITGHSMGGAMASFCALDLVVNYGFGGVKLMTFGQPRIGNAAFASYFKKYLPHAIRVTHAHDIVPHLPPYFAFFPQKTYHHFPREVWVHNVRLGSLIYSVEQICDDSGEDPACSRSVSGNSVQDHVYYLGVSMHAEAWSTCRIVMDYNTLRYEMDLNGNIVLSKQPGLSNE